MDNYGNSEWFFSGHANIGYGVGTGINVKEIRNVNGNDFHARDYQGYSSGYSWGALYFNRSHSGDKANWEFDGFNSFGYLYIEESGGLSISPIYFVGWWSNSSTKLFNDL